MHEAYRVGMRAVCELDQCLVLPERARMANLARVNAGAEVLIGRVDLTIEGVRAQALDPDRVHARPGD